MRHMPLTPAAEKFDEQAADTVIMLALMLARRVSNQADAAAVTTIADQTLGIVGFDRSAQAVARRAAEGFGMRILVHGQSHADNAKAKDMGATISPSLDQLLAEADIVSLHGQPGADSNNFFDARRLNQMKPDACLINTTHGGLIDEQALIHALWFETIGGAGFWVAPSTLSRLAEFQASDNAIILAHPAGHDSAFGTRSAHAINAAAAEIADNVVQFASPTMT